MASRPGSSGRPGVVTLVEGSVLRSAASHARLVFLATVATAAVLGAIVLTPWFGPLWGFVLGLAAGFVLGLLAGAVVAVWPVLRVLWHWSAEITLCLLLVSGRPGCQRARPRWCRCWPWSLWPRPCSGFRGCVAGCGRGCGARLCGTDCG